MRAALFAGLACLVFAIPAYAQYGGRADNRPQASQQSGRPTGGSGNGRSGHNQPEHPPPPPLRRCPDLAIANYTFISAIPGAPALGPDEIALQWEVHNGGNAAYDGDPAGQSLKLEYSSPSGSHELAQTLLPMPASTTGAEPAAVTPISLAQGRSWRGYLRATMTPEARRRTLRLTLYYAADGFHSAINDCDLDNNVVDLAR